MIKLSMLKYSISYINIHRIILGTKNDTFNTSKRKNFNTSKCLKVYELIKISQFVFEIL